VVRTDHHPDVSNVRMAVYEAKPIFEIRFKKGTGWRLKGQTGIRDSRR
jgi:hypothetical protein